MVEELAKQITINTTINIRGSRQMCGRFIVNIIVVFRDAIDHKHSSINRIRENQRDL